MTPATAAVIPGVSNRAQGHMPRLCLNSISHPDPQAHSDTPEESRVHTEKRSLVPFPPFFPPPRNHTFLHGLEDTSNEALNALLCWVVKMVLGRLGRLWSLPSSVAPFPAPWADLQRLSSSSLLPERSRK